MSRESRTQDVNRRLVLIGMAASGVVLAAADVALAQGTKDNEALRVFAAAGYNDLTTSYFAMRSPTRRTLLLTGV